MEVITYQCNIPLKSWCPDLEETALIQAKNLSNLPFAFKHIALMPDAHMGYGMPIGGVLATKQVVIPNAVGVDIGCGMTAVKLPIKGIDRDALRYILNLIRKDIPVGYNKNKHGNDDAMPQGYGELPIVKREFDNASKSLGTLGGGNHFIEIQQDVDSDDIYVMLHSGSRNLGKQVAEYYNKEAVTANKTYYVDVPKEWGLAFLPLDSVVGQQYMREMKYCIAFAKASRRIMLRKIIHIFYAMLDLKEDHDEPIDCCHNFAQYEHHFGEDVMVHRKGATMARGGTIALIPGSQGSFSFIVQGRGSEDSFHSCSHGAGRKMGRKDAKKRLNLQQEVAHLDDMGVIHSIRGDKQLDEATGAYKDILSVMNNQQDLVSVLHQLKPLAVIKG